VLPLILQLLPGVDESVLWSRLSDAALAGIAPLIPFLLDAERQQRQQQRGNCSDGPHFSQLFGVDVLLDEHGAAWLLEVNSFPSLSLGATVSFQGEGKCCRCMDDYKPHVHIQSAVDQHVKLLVVQGTIELLLGRYAEMISCQRVALDDGRNQTNMKHHVTCTGSHQPAAPATMSSEPIEETVASVMPLVLDNNTGLALEAFSVLAEVFGRCCKSGSQRADSFRLRKLFVALGRDVHAGDWKLRQLAQRPEGLSLLPVLALLLEELRVASGNALSMDGIAATLRQASEGL
jgi:hypothetical protein